MFHVLFHHHDSPIRTTSACLENVPVILKKHIWIWDSWFQYQTLQLRILNPQSADPGRRNQYFYFVKGPRRGPKSKICTGQTSVGQTWVVQNFRDKEKQRGKPYGVLSFLVSWSSQSKPLGKQQTRKLQLSKLWMRAKNERKPMRRFEFFLSWSS